MAATISFASQASTEARRDCGAACLSVVYKSFGKNVPQADIWPMIARRNRFGSMASTTHLMALHALDQGLSAVIVQARHPLQVLRRCREAGIRAILNHRPQLDAANGHYTVMADIDDRSVLILDPSLGVSRRMSHGELMELWQPESAYSEITGNVLICIAAGATSIPACEFCHAAIPSHMHCPKCGEAVGLNPASVLGCIRDGCIARMWTNIACPSCDFLFDETGKPSADLPRPAVVQTPAFAPPDLEKAFAQVDQLCAIMLAIPNAARFPDLKQQVDFIQGSKEKLRLAQAEEIAGLNQRLDRLAAQNEESKKKAEARRQEAAERKAPLPALDGNALGAALLRDLGFQ